MPDYNSAYTGAQIDGAVAKVSSFTHTPAQIDSAVNKVSSIASTAVDIDDAVSYIGDLEGDSVSASDIALGLGIMARFTNTPEDIDATVDKFETVNSQPSQIDDTVEKIVDNNALAGELLTADGTGGSVWMTPPTARKIYQHTVLLTKTDGANTSRLTVEWYDSDNASSTTIADFGTYISGNYQNTVPKVALGVYWDNGVAIYINGIYYSYPALKFVLVPDDYPSTSAVELTSFSGWTYSQNTMEVG